MKVVRYSLSNPCAVRAEMDEAERKAWESLARYKFMMFGYWAALWVHFNRVGKFRSPNPFVEVVKLARGRIR